MKKLVTLAALAALLAAPAMAREFTPYTGEYPGGDGNPRADIVLEYDGDAYYGYGTSPGWTDDSVVNYEVPDGGPYLVCEFIAYLLGTSDKQVEFWDGVGAGGLFDPPSSILDNSVTFNPGIAPPFPPPDYTVVDVSSVGMVAASGDIVRPGCVFYGDDDAVGLADAFADGNPGHSWALYLGGWTDDTYGYYTDDGIRLGLCTGTPTEETTWGQVKGLFR